MPMRRAIPACTAEQQRRQDRCRELGCVACIQDDRLLVLGEIHHLTESGRTISQWHTIALCAFHHRGEPGAISKSLATELIGPSLALNRRAFHARYGTNEELLTIQNELIGAPMPDVRHQRKSRGKTAKPSKSLDRNPPSWRQMA